MRIKRVGAGLLVLLPLLVIPVLVTRPQAASEPADKDAQTIVVVKAGSDGAVECSYFRTTPAREGITLYHWSGPRLRTELCPPARGGGLIGLG